MSLGKAELCINLKEAATLVPELALNDLRSEDFMSTEVSNLEVTL